MGLLNVSKNAKTIKSEKVGVLTGILYLAPSDISGHQVCPFASKGCLASCLFTAGRGAMNCTQRARVAKTQLLFMDRDAFVYELHWEIAKLKRKAAREGMIPAVRLNGTSDLPWEKMTALIDGKRQTLMRANPDVIFYDYTKSPFRARKSLTKAWPTNYAITLSRSESNEKVCLDALSKGINVSVVFDSSELPITWHGFEVINGDDHDARMLDGRANDDSGLVIGLVAKGKARKDASGFVVQSSIAIAA